MRTISKWLIALSTLSLIHVATADPAPTAPLAVTAVSVGTIAIVEWTPSVDATGYKVYGVGSGGSSLLATISNAAETMVTVGGGYDLYGVSSTSSSGESSITYNIEGLCVDPTLTPPTVTVGNCDGLSPGNVPLKATVRYPQ